MFLVNSRNPRVPATPFRLGREVHHVQRAHLLPKLRCQFAEFLNQRSLTRLGILAPPTCVGLRYGHERGSARGFSRKHGITGFRSRSSTSSPLGVDPAFVPKWVLQDPPTGLNWTIHQSSSAAFLRPFYRNTHSGAGILTCFPSPTPFGLGLGTD